MAQPAILPGRTWLTRRRGDGVTAALMLAPAVLGFLVFYVYPSVKGVYYSLTDWNLLSDPDYVGLDNYREVAADPQFWKSMGVTALFVVYTLGSQLVLALA